MSVTRKQKSEAKKSRETDIVSDLENRNIKIGSSRFGRGESDFDRQA